MTSRSVRYSSARAVAPFVAAMAAVVVLSNVLVQFPVRAVLGPVDLADTLTWGAFTYPIAFLVTDLVNRRLGPTAARRVVVIGFLIAVLLSIALASPRIAIASGSAFLVAQLLDVSVFDRLRAGAWWRAPLASSALGSLVDTLIFFSLAFAPAFAMLDLGNEPGSLGFPAPLLGVGPDVPLWISLALGDLIVKGIVALALLGPYGALRGREAEPETAAA